MEKTLKFYRERDLARDGYTTEEMDYVQKVYGSFRDYEVFITFKEIRVNKIKKGPKFGCSSLVYVCFDTRKLNFKKGHIRIRKDGIPVYKRSLVKNGSEKEEIFRYSEYPEINEEEIQVAKQQRKKEVIRERGNPYSKVEEDIVPKVNHISEPPRVKSPKRESIKFKEITELLDELQTQKGINYGLADNAEQESWNNGGEIGAFYTVKRKIDRLTRYVQQAIKNGHIDENMNVSKEGKEGEPIIETLADLAVYSTKWVQWLANGLDPESFIEWKDRNKLGIEKAYSKIVGTVVLNGDINDRTN